MKHLPAMACLCWLASNFNGIRADETSQVEFFEQRIRPVLVERCYPCHNSHDTAEAELVLDHRQALLSGGTSGKLISENVTESLLLKVLRHDIEGLEMPQDGPKLDAQIIADFEQWIASGAIDPRDAPPSAQELAASTSWEALRQKRMEWWSFQPIRNPVIPSVEPTPSENEPVAQTNEAVDLAPIDRFLRSAQTSVGLTPNPRADRETLIRRITLSLVGLPPTPEQIEAFVTDSRADAYERLVDALLDSQQFGERWGRHWLDWLRYAESHGSEGDPLLAGAHLYRDYIIRALNADVPYDQLVREHVAGDLIEDPRINRELGINESVIGTAQWRMVFHGFAPTDALDEKVRFTDDAIDTVTKAFLGLTVSCARCHDHKFDAISQADYTALFGILASTRPGRTAIELPEQLNARRAELAALKPQLRGALADDWLQSLPGLSERVLYDDQLKAAANDKRHVLYPLAQLKLNDDAESTTKSFVARLKKLSHDFEEDQRLHASVLDMAVGPHWNLADSDDYANWFRYGQALDRGPSPAGQFAISATDQQVVTGVYPAGVITHLLSDKLGARLTSGEFTAQQNTTLWLQLIGGGSAMSRYVVENYPRNGTVYPVTEMKDQHPSWRWQAYDISYWQGDPLHVELTTALDAPLLVKEQPRSWFGLRRVLVTASDQPPPELSYFEGLAPLFDAIEVKVKTPTSTAELAEALVDVLQTAIEHWREDQTTDAEALLIDAFLKHELLPNTLETLPRAGALVTAYRQVEEQVPVATRAPTLDEWQGADSRLFERGNHLQPRGIVPRRFLEAIDNSPYDAKLSGREQLADDLLRVDNPFTARVIVNRIWLHLFGQGLVPSPDNFERLGALPRHPELLDHLATTFRDDDQWSIKSMIRRIVTSQAWQQSSTPSSVARQHDPDNNYYTHFALQRLSAEAIRDCLLTVSGELDLKMYGESVAGETPRRSVYVRVIRNNLDPFLSAFDAPVPFACQGKRDVTNVPAQSLLLLNGELALTAASHVANRLLSNAELTSDERRIDYLWRIALGRSPSADELQAARDFLRSGRTTGVDSVEPSIDNKGDSTPHHAASTDEWSELAHAVLNLKEFIYVR